MPLIRTSKEFREVAARVALRAEDFIPETDLQGHWRLPALSSPQERDEQTQNLIKKYVEDYQPIILDHYKEKGLSLSWKSPEKWAFASKAFEVDQVVVMIVVRNPQITYDPDPTTGEGGKTLTPTSSIDIPDQALIKKLHEKREARILKSHEPRHLDPFDLEVGDILALEEKQGLIIRTGGVMGSFIPYEIKRPVEGGQQHEA
ncbi:hypothetical protein LTS17_012917 [Exophiala oligosperma]